MGAQLTLNTGPVVDQWCSNVSVLSYFTEINGNVSFTGTKCLSDTGLRENTKSTVLTCFRVSNRPLNQQGPGKTVVLS